MVRETRHLWVGNLPDNIREERIREHFQRYGRVQSVKLLPRTGSSAGKDDDGGGGGGSAGGSSGGTGYCAAVAFMDIKSAAKAHASENSLDDRCLVTDYYEPLLQDRASTPGGSGGGGSVGGGGGGSSATPSSNNNNSSSRSHVNSGGGGGYDRSSSSHYFERRGGGVDPDGSGFLRRQAPVNHYRDRSYRSSNGPFGRDERGSSAGGHYRPGGGPSGPSGWNSPYESLSSRYPPHDYGMGDERSERVSGSDFGSGPSSGGGKRTTSSSSSSLPAGSVNTPLSTRKRKSSRSPSRSRSRSDSRTPPSSSRSRSRSHSPASSASVPSRGGGSRSRSTSPGSRLRSRTLSPRSRSSSRSSNSSPHSQTSRTVKTPRSAQSSSSPRSSRSSQGSSRSPGWLSTSSAATRARSSRHRLSGGTSGSAAGLVTTHSSSSPAGQLCHSTGSTGSADNDRRPLAICVRNLPLRSSDTSLKDGLFHEYKKHGKVVTVKVAGQGSDRVAIVRFKKAEDVDKALEVSRDKLFFGCKIEVTPWDSGLDLDDNEFRPLEADLDEYHPKATRTLFIGNLEKDVTSADLRASFEVFGPIIEIDIKKQSQGSSSSASGTSSSGGSSGGGGSHSSSGSSGSLSSNNNNNNNNSNSAYAFCQYADIASVVRAMRHLDGEQVGNTRVKLGFGKSMPTNCVWLHGVADTVAEKFLARHMSRFGHVSYTVIDRERCNGLVFYDQVSCAQAAVQELRGRALAGRKLQVDFASRECQAHFFELVEREPRSSGSSASAAAATASMQHRLPSAPLASSTTATSGRTVRTPSCSSRSSTHSKERTGSSSSRSRHGGTLSRDDSMERDADMKDLTMERDPADRRCLSRSPSPCEKDCVTTTPSSRSSDHHRRYHRRPSVEPADAVLGSPVVERERTRRYGSGGSSSSSGLSMDTGSTGPSHHLATTNGSAEVFSRIRDLSEERVGAISSGEEGEEGAASDLETSTSKPPSSSGKKASKKAKKKKSKLSGSSDSGVSDVSTNEPLPSAHPPSVASASSLAAATSSPHPSASSSSAVGQGSTASSTTPTRETGGKGSSGATSSSSSSLLSSSRPSRRVSRLSTDSSGDGATGSGKHSLPRIIPWEVETKKSRQQPEGSSRPGTPLCDESDEVPTDPRSRERPARLTERPMSLPLPRFALELNLGSKTGSASSSSSNNASGCTSSTSKPASAAVTPSSASSTDGTFRIPHPHGTSVSPSRASAATATSSSALPGSPRGAPGDPTAAHPIDSSSDSECSSGSSPQRASLSTAAVSLAEQLRQWEQRYEQWSTRSSHSVAGSDLGPSPAGAAAVASPTILSSSSSSSSSAGAHHHHHHPAGGSGSSHGAPTSAAERYRLARKARPMSLEELKSQEPSDIVRCLLAKHSVFDEDLKRLESSGRDTPVTPATPTTPAAVSASGSSHSPSSTSSAPTTTGAGTANKESHTMSRSPAAGHVSVPQSSPVSTSASTIAANNSRLPTPEVTAKPSSPPVPLPEVSPVSSSASAPAPPASLAEETTPKASARPKTPPSTPPPPPLPPPAQRESPSRPPSPPPCPSPPPPPAEAPSAEPIQPNVAEEEPEGRHLAAEAMEVDSAASTADEDTDGKLVIVSEEEAQPPPPPPVEDKQPSPAVSSPPVDEPKGVILPPPPPPPPPPVLEPEVSSRPVPSTVEAPVQPVEPVGATAPAEVPAVKPPRVKHQDSSSSSSKPSSRDSKSGERSRHTSSSSSSHRKDKDKSSSKHHDKEPKESKEPKEPKEPKETKSEPSDSSSSNHQLARRKSREAGEQQQQQASNSQSGNSAESSANSKRRRSVDNGGSGPSAAKRVKSEVRDKEKEKEKEKDKSKTHDKENKETPPTSVTPKSTKSERKDSISSSATPVTSSKSHSSSSSSSLSSSTVTSSKKSSKESGVDNLKSSSSSKPHEASESKPSKTSSNSSSSKSSSTKTSSSKKDKEKEKEKDKDKDKDRGEKERSRDKEKRKEEEREVERKKRTDEERPDKKKEEAKEHKDKAKTQQSPASATGSSSTHRRRSDGDRTKSSSSKGHADRKAATAQRSTSTTSSSRKKSQSDSDSSDSSDQSEAERSHARVAGGSKASSDEGDSDSDRSNDGSDYSPTKADRALAEFLENEPTYFSMYDKVKARSLKLQQQKRQEEERKSLQQQQQDKFCALRQARIGNSKRDKDGKKLNSWDSSDSSDEEEPVRQNRPRPVATASLLSSNASKLSSSSSSSSSEDSEPSHPTPRSNKSKDFLFDHPSDAKSSSKSSKASQHATQVTIKSKPIVSSSDSDSEPEVKTPSTKTSTKPAKEATASVSKRRPSAPEVNHSKTAGAESGKKVERSQSTVLPSKKSKKDTGNKLIHSSSCGAQPSKLSSRGEEKMETIFGPISDDSDDQQQQQQHHHQQQKSSRHTPAASARLQVAMIYSSDSDSAVHVKASAVKQESAASSPPLDAKAERSDKRKKKSKESRSRDRKKSGSKEGSKEGSSESALPNHHHHHHHGSSKSSSKASEELLEAGRALESKLMEDSLIAIAHLAQKEKDKEKEAELLRGSIEHVKSKKKKKKSSKNRDEAPPAVAKSSDLPLPLVGPLSEPLVVKTEPLDVCHSAPVASSSPRVPSSKPKLERMEHVPTDPKLMSMPSLWDQPGTPAAGPSASLPPSASAVSVEPKPVAGVQQAAAPRPAIWKQETEDAVAGLLLETFDDFKMETMEEVEPAETLPRGLLRETTSPPEGEESSPPQPNEEALKAIQSLQCEDDLDLSGEMIIDSEAGASSTEDTPAPPDGPLYSGSSSSDAAEMAVRLNASNEKPNVETAPTPPPSPPELCIDETRCTHPDSESNSSPRKEMSKPRTPDVDLSSKSPRTPRTPDVRPFTPDLPPFAHPTLKSEMLTAQQQQHLHHQQAQQQHQHSPAKRGRKPGTQLASGRGRRGRGGRSTGSSRGVSESSVEGHDADVYEFNDTEEEGASTPSTVPTTTASSSATAHAVTVPASSSSSMEAEQQQQQTQKLQQQPPQPAEVDKHHHHPHHHHPVEANSADALRNKDAEGLKGRLMLVDPRTTIDDTIENVVRGNHHPPGGPSAAAIAAHHMMLTTSSGSPASPRGGIQSPRAHYAASPATPSAPGRTTAMDSSPASSATGAAPAVMKVELPQPLMKEPAAGSLVDPITGHLTAVRRSHDEAAGPTPPPSHGGIFARRPEDVPATASASSSPSTVVLNLRSGTGQQPQQQPASGLVKVPSPKLAVITTSNLPASTQHHPLLTSSSSVTITPTAPPANPPTTSTVIQTGQSGAASAEVARLPSATVVTPVPAKTSASGPSYPAVPLTRDAPPHGLLLQQQQMQLQQPQKQHQQGQQAQSGPTSGQQQPQQQPAVVQASSQQQQQHSAHQPQLPLPAGVPVSLSGGATVIAVASNGRASGPPPLIGRQTVVSVPQSMNQSQSTMGGGTVVIARSTGPATQATPASSRVQQQQQQPATPSQPQQQPQRPPPAVVTLYSSGGYPQQQPGAVVSAVSSARPSPVTASTGSSVSVLPATSRPPLSTSSSSSSSSTSAGGGVSVYPIYGTRAELTPIPPSSAGTQQPFGPSMAAASVRLPVTQAPTSGGRATVTQAPVVSASAPYNRQAAYPPSDPQAHHYAAAYHHLAQQQQHSPNVAPAEPPRQQSSTPAREEAELQRGPMGSTAALHPHLLQRELPTPPPAHQHSPSQPVTPQMMHQQQLMFQQFMTAARAGAVHPEFARSMGAPYSPAPPASALQQAAHGAGGPVESAERERERSTGAQSALPLHLRALAAGGEHRTTESPMQACVAVPFPQQPQQLQQLYAHHRSGSGSAVYQTPGGHLLAPPSPSHQHRHPAYAQEMLQDYRPSPPPAHLGAGGGILQRANVVNAPQPIAASEAPSSATSLVRPPAMRTPPPHISQAPPQGDSLVMLLQKFPIMWQGLMALKNDHAVVQMHFISGNPMVARGSLPCTPEGMALPLRIAQRMRLEQQQLEGVARKVQVEQEHCILLALPCGRDAMDVVQQSNNLRQGFITYLQLKQAAGIVNVVTGPQGYSDAGATPSYVVHIFPACEFANDTLGRITPDLLHRVTDIAHLLVVIATV